MRGLGNRNASARALSDLGDFAATTTDDAANHIGRDANVLRVDVFAILVGQWGGRASVGVSRAARVVSRCGITKVGTIASAVERPATVAGRGGRGAAAVGGSRSSALDSDSGIVEDGTVAALFIVYQALANLPDGLLDTVGGSLDFDNAFGRLREHLLLSYHADSRSILDLLDLETLATDDGAHLVVRDE